MSKQKKKLLIETCPRSGCGMLAFKSLLYWLANCVTFGKLQNQTVPQFLHL